MANNEQKKWYKHLINLENKTDLFDIEDEIKNTKFWNKYVSIVKHCTTSFLGSQIHIAVNRMEKDSSDLWTDHGPDHAYHVLKIVDELYNRFKSDWLITDKEHFFILISSVWCHDLGMFGKRLFFSINEQRQYHGRLSGNILYAMKYHLDKEFIQNRKKLTTNEINKIALVCATHQSNCSLGILNHKRKLLLLGSILRLADALDIGIHRATYEFYNYFNELYGKPSNSSNFEWIVNRLLTRNAIEVNETEIKYNIEIPEQFRDDLKNHKISNYRQEFSKDEFEIYESKFVDVLKRYIKFYLLDHIISIEKQINPPELKWLKRFKQFSLIINGEGNSFDIELKNRKKYQNILNKKKKFWMNMVNIDKNIANRLKKIRCGASIENLYLFLFDFESNQLQLWASQDFYEDDNNDDYFRDLQKIRIPIKCGIVGYVAWSGINESVSQLRYDWRETYGTDDEKLELEHIQFRNLISKDREIYGVILFNFRDIKYSENFSNNFWPLGDVSDSYKNQIINDNLKLNIAYLCNQLKNYSV